MKNPILKFRNKVISKSNNGELGKYCMKSGVHKNSAHCLNSNNSMSSTLITKTREAVDMSETSFE